MVGEEAWSWPMAEPSARPEPGDWRDLGKGRGVGAKKRKPRRIRVQKHPKTEIQTESRRKRDEGTIRVAIEAELAR